MNRIYIIFGINSNNTRDKLFEKNLVRWLISLIIISIAFSFISILYQYDRTPMSYSHYNVRDSSSLKDIMNVDKLHPPPLFNFIDYHKPI